MAIKILKEKFKKHRCPAPTDCPTQALTQKDENTVPVVDEAKCIECGLCTEICPHGEYTLEV